MATGSEPNVYRYQLKTWSRAGAFGAVLEPVRSQTYIDICSERVLDASLRTPFDTNIDITLIADRLRIEVSQRYIDIGLLSKLLKNGTLGDGKVERF